MATTVAGAAASEHQVRDNETANNLLNSGKPEEALKIYDMLVLDPGLEDDARCSVHANRGLALDMVGKWTCVRPCDATVALLLYYCIHSCTLWLVLSVAEQTAAVAVAIFSIVYPSLIVAAPSAIAPCHI